MATAARMGYGTKLKMGDGGSPEAFTEIAEIKSLEDSDSVEILDATNHQSTGNRREYINGLIDGDEVPLTLNYLSTNATQNRITGLQSKVGGAAVNFRLEEPGNPTGYQFAALVISVGKSYPVDAIMEMTVTLKKTGAITTYTV